MKNKKKRSLNSYQKNEIKKRHGYKCDLCGRRREKKLLEVHHKDGVQNHNFYNNYAVMCGIKTKENCHGQLHALVKSAASGEKEREKNKTPDIPIKNMVDYQDGPVEMQVNDFAEMPYRNWLKAKILSNLKKKYLKKEAIYAGAEKNDVSPTTSRKYYEKLVSEEGPLKEFKDPIDKKKYVTYKKWWPYILKHQSDNPNCDCKICKGDN